MKLIFILAFTICYTPLFAHENLDCPNEKVVVHNVTVPDKPLTTAIAGGLNNTAVWVVISVPRKSFSEEIKVQYDRHVLSLKKMREVEKRIDFWFEVYDTGRSEIIVYRDYVPSEIQEVTTTKLPAPKCWGYSN